MNDRAVLLVSAIAMLVLAVAALLLAAAVGVGSAVVAGITYTGGT